MTHYRRTETSVFQVPVPWLLGICFDCTVSISKGNFATAQRELINFLLNVHRRATLLPGLPSDFVAITAFKERGNIFGPRAPLNIVKMDQASHVRALCQWILNLRRDGKNTALYDAIKVASSELLAIDRQLPYRYLKIVLAITDGEDNNSRIGIRDLSYFNRTSLHLAVIGVGSSTSGELRRLNSYATMTYSINRFEDLFQAITVVIQSVIHRQTDISF